uniref:Uncharacterized protein n=1 Tax=Sphaerodactylus townsendi TaxID=933632 RepID=A0ACB8F957_9SAUR
MAMRAVGEGAIPSILQLLVWTSSLESCITSGVHIDDEVPVKHSRIGPCHCLADVSDIHMHVMLRHIQSEGTFYDYDKANVDSTTEGTATDPNNFKDPSMELVKTDSEMMNKASSQEIKTMLTMGQVRARMMSTTSGDLYSDHFSVSCTRDIITNSTGQ